MKQVIIGGGIIGAATAFRLAQAGAEVVVLDAGAARATGASFGWINASFYHDAPHHHLRAEGLRAFERLAEEIAVPVRRCGSLCWDAPPEDLRRQAGALRALGYAVEEIGPEDFARLAPGVAARPELALHFPQEAAAESALLAEALLLAAQGQGARVLRNVRVEAIRRAAGQVQGVETSAGFVAADRVLVAAGTGTPALLGPLGIDLPMLHRPALILTTAPVDVRLDPILVAPIGEIRQLPGGGLLMPTAAGHQGDASEALSGAVEGLAEAALARLRTLFPDERIALAEVAYAERPVPGDGLPVVGELLPGLSVAVMHSGITLAAVMGELIARELTQGAGPETERWLAPYRPGRFAGVRGQ